MNSVICLGVEQGVKKSWQCDVNHRRDNSLERKVKVEQENK